MGGVYNHIPVIVRNLRSVLLAQLTALRDEQPALGDDYLLFLRFNIPL